MLLKMMGNEKLPDSDTRKLFQILDNVESVTFVRGSSGNAIARVLFTGGEDEDFDLIGNAYLMNRDGRTVAAFGADGKPLRRA